MSDPGKSGRDLTPEEARRLRENVIFGPSGGGGSGSPPPSDPGCWLALFRILLVLIAGVDTFASHGVRLFM